MHALVNENIFIEVRIVQRLGEGEVVRGVEGVAGVQEEGDLATDAADKVSELRLEPVNSVLVGDV